MLRNKFLLLFSPLPSLNVPCFDQWASDVIAKLEARAVVVDWQEGRTSPNGDGSMELAALVSPGHQLALASEVEGLKQTATISFCPCVVITSAFQLLTDLDMMLRSLLRMSFHAPSQSLPDLSIPSWPYVPFPARFIHFLTDTTAHRTPFCSLAFSPDQYALNVVVTAENAAPVCRLVLGYKSSFVNLHPQQVEKKAHASVPPASSPPDLEAHQSFVSSSWWGPAHKSLLRFLESTITDPASPDSCYVYSLSRIRQNVSSLSATLPVDKFFFPMKANPHCEIMSLLHNVGFGFECVSKQEVQRILSLFPNIDLSRILFTPNFASRQDYAFAFSLAPSSPGAGSSIHVTLDNIWLLQSCANILYSRSVMIRVDPGRGEGDHDHVRTGGARSKFGVSVDQLVSNLPLIRALSIKVVGLHIHAGSGVFDVDNWRKNAEMLTSLLPHFPEVRYLNLGGGLGVPYRPGEAPLDLHALSRTLREWREDHAAALRGIEVWMEPGRFIVADAGVLLARVTQLKEKSQKRFVGVSTGMNSLIRPALYDAYHHIINLSRLDICSTELLQLCDVVGHIYESSDVLGRDRWLPSSTEEGDTILIATAGAYGYCMSSQYNLRTPAREVVFE